ACGRSLVHHPGRGCKRIGGPGFHRAAPHAFTARTRCRLVRRPSHSPSLRPPASAPRVRHSRPSWACRSHCLRRAPPAATQHKPRLNARAHARTAASREQSVRGDEARRVTAEQQTPDNQIDVLTEWARRLGHELVHVYVDRQTGSTDDRPALKEALRAAHERQYDVLLVAALDRVSRGGVASLAGILEKLKAAGVGIKSHREEWLDSTNPMLRELLVAIFAWVAKSERETLIARTLAGMARAKRAGVHIGRPRAGIDADQA